LFYTSNFRFGKERYYGNADDTDWGGFARIFLVEIQAKLRKNLRKSAPIRVIRVPIKRKLLVLCCVQDEFVILIF
jgi:hypothetical protein